MKPYALTFIFLSFCATFAQGQKSCAELATTVEFWENIRILPPVQITDYDGRRISYVIDTREGLHLGEMELYADADLPTNFAKDWKKKSKRWWICYCALDKRVFFIQDVELNKKIWERSKK